MKNINNNNNKNVQIEIEPRKLQFNQKNNRVDLTITNKGLDLVDLQIKIKSNQGEYFKIPYLRGNETICESNKAGTVPLNPLEHQLFYVYYQPENKEQEQQQQQQQDNQQSELELKYSDTRGKQNLITIPIIIS